MKVYRVVCVVYSSSDSENDIIDTLIYDLAGTCGPRQHPIEIEKIREYEDEE